ncbi:hypothetical protein EOD39_14034 [Acipenser ruthenus]|uniref:LINE-1 type transposase domain-containing protein 1 n=1 Tax=Acipenser ruthenus TaxID=7906 RepID=A0A444UHA4_ACIRT|nr:hypothetical protein EOD39_14034 [Acipenser ruthenus]
MTASRKESVASPQSTPEGKHLKKSMGPEDWEMRLAEVTLAFKGSVQKAIDADLRPIFKSVADTTVVLNALKNEVTDIASSVKKLTARQDNTRAALRQQKGEINQCNARIDAMQDKVADLEDRNRRCNIRLVGLPEGVESDDPVRFLQKEIPRWFPAMVITPLWS